MDNLEHLLAVTGLIGDVLAAAPKVKILATSRERLSLQAEWLCELGGLSFAAKAPLSSDAVDLFVQAARKVRPDFTLDDKNAPLVLRACELVQGMPLGIELAAAWLGVLPLQDIVPEIERGLDFLETDLRDLPERQHSIRAIFDASWQQLSANEQEVFMGLSVFRGGFSREAARDVAGANLKTLRTLTNKSLITLSEGRYTVHELLRQYAAGRLTQPAACSLKKVHSCYFIKTLLASREAILFANQLEAATELERELENLRAALRWAVEEGDVAVFAPPFSS